ncbi:vicilin Cor a 11.0101-like isoform X1 [Nymphaea colorata]|nr:vicilin Cor a 11.0101-like isoform X1 [Nymphaea colorata]
MASRSLFAVLLLLLLSLTSVWPSALSERDPLKECKQRCHREISDERERRMCERRCEEAAERRGDESASIFFPERDMRKECERQCRREGRGRSEGWQEECCRRCVEESEERQRGRDDFIEKREGRVEQGKENPYVWKQGEFQTKCRSEEGFSKLLPNFAEKSDLLKGLQNYRVEWIETRPNTMVVPHHKDADSLIYVCNGKGTIGILMEDKQETFDVSKGDIMVIPAGTTGFVANTDESENLCIFKILDSRSTSPGRVESFFGIGGEDQESFFQSFSSEILEAAFNTHKDQLRRLFGARKRVIVKASPEQIREISRSGSKGGSHIWPFTGDSHGPYNLLDRKPWFSNRHGQIYRADENDHSPLRHFDVTVSFANLSAGSMLSPAMNSRAIKLAIVTNGSGYIEMACPHLSSQQKGEQETQGTRYRKVSAELRPMTVFIEPAGHPSAIVAKEDLQIICFDINARGNHKYMLAGKNNIYSNLRGAAGELAFGVSSKECERVLGAQEEEVIVKGPKGGGSSREM